MYYLYIILDFFCYVHRLTSYLLFHRNCKSYGFPTGCVVVEDTDEVVVLVKSIDVELLVVSGTVVVAILVLVAGCTMTIDVVVVDKALEVLDELDEVVLGALFQETSVE